MAKEHSKALTEAKERLANSRIAPKGHRIGEKTVEAMKKSLGREEPMVLKIINGLDEEGLHVLFLVFEDAETGEIYGEFNASHPCPPYDDCC